MIHAIRYTLYALIILIIGCATPELSPQSSALSPQLPVLVWPPPPQTPRIQYVRSISGPQDIGTKVSWFKKTINAIFGKEDDMEEIMLRPYGVFADSERIYVTDPGSNSVHIFDMKEKRHLIIRNGKKENLISPIGIAVDKNGELYVSDSVLKKVLSFDREGKYLREIGSSQSFIRPTGIAIDEERIYVVDTHAHHVLVFSKKEGTFLFHFGKHGNGKGDFNYPTHICIDKNGFLYITDSMNFRVQIFDRDGNFISTFGKHGDGSGDFSKSKGIAVDSEGHIYVADAHFDTVQIFDKAGNFLLDFGKTGSEEGQMVLPSGIFIDEQDRIYVADSYNRRIQIFQYLKEKKELNSK
ncbi:MAG: 6-bladed beta-propeller [Nitrospira sp.]|nr:6-bladed beta-propeller [Nitrospira sp.]